MIGLRMNDSRKEKYALDKVALLGIFALGLLIAQLFVSAKSHLAFSKPFELPYSGVSVKIPQGNGWHSEGTWQFIANTFTTSSLFSPTSGRITALVEVQYLPAPSQLGPEQQIEHHSRKLGGTTIETGNMQNAGISIDWAHIKIHDKLIDVYFGIAQLQNGRRLTIEAQGSSSEADWIEQNFTGTIETIHFEENYLLENGRKIVEQLKTRGLTQLIPNHNQQHFFLIKDEGEQIQGFLTDLLTISTDEQDSRSTRFAQLYYIQALQGSLSGHSLFQGDQKLRQFLWISKTGSTGLIDETTTQIELAEDNSMTVKSYIPMVSRSYAIGPAAIPEIFIEPLIGLLLESGITEVLVDLIFSDGRIIPTRLSVIDTGQNDTDPPAAYKVRLDFLDQQNYYGKMYFDYNKQHFRTMLSRQNTYIFQRSNKDEVLKHFPVWRDYLLQMEKQSELKDNLKEPEKINYAPGTI